MTAPTSDDPTLGKLVRDLMRSQAQAGFARSCGTRRLSLRLAGRPCS